MNKNRNTNLSCKNEDANYARINVFGGRFYSEINYKIESRHYGIIADDKRVSWQ